MNHFKCMVVGDGAVGKTSLLYSFIFKKFPVNYVPTIFDNFEFKNQEINLSLWDTAGQEGYNRLRPLSYPDTHIFIICFAVNLPSSFDNVQHLWHHEVLHYCPNVPLVLVGTKSDIRDLRENYAGENLISYEQGLKLAKQINARFYMECSALLHINIDELFDKVIRICLETKQEKKKTKCIIL